MKCSWVVTAIEKCDNHATQVVLAICENSHIRERTFCDIHASDYQDRIRQETRMCPQCDCPYLETEIREIHQGFKL